MPRSMLLGNWSTRMGEGRIGVSLHFPKSASDLTNYIDKVTSSIWPELWVKSTEPYSVWNRCSSSELDVIFINSSGINETSSIQGDIYSSSSHTDGVLYLLATIHIMWR